MADRHPYATAPGYLTQVITQFRKSFPQTVNADTLKKLGFAPNNESYILNILRFLELIDQDGKRTEFGQKIFTLHDNDTFAEEFGKRVTGSYSDLFELHGDDAWNLDVNGLMTFFRSADGTTERVGKLQAKTFGVLASFSGHGESSEKITVTKQTSAPKVKPQKKVLPKSEPKSETSVITQPSNDIDKKRDFGLTVRIEINLPATGDKDTYDLIFKSIRENLLDV